MALCIALIFCGLAIQAKDSEAIIRNPATGLRLGATISMPDSGQPRAGVVLISGSGQQDRDETILGHKPFRAIADSLCQAGYAVARYDDRGIGASDMGPNLRQATTDSLALDAVAVMQHLDSILGHSVPMGYIGHSEGGSIAIKLAADTTSAPDFIVTLAGPAMRGDSIILDQVRISMMAAGQAAMWKQQYPILRARYNLAMSDVPEFALKVALYSDVARTPGSALISPDRINAEISAMSSPWYREFLRYDPAADIAAINIPWLAINGDKDTQVPAANLQRIAELNPGAQTALMPGLNHLLLKANTGLASEYKSLVGDIDPSVINEILQFLNSITSTQ